MRKGLILNAVFALFALPVMANADELITHNNTDFDSAVRVTSGAFNGQCTGTQPPSIRAITPAHQTVPVTWDRVQALCLFSIDTCTAEIHMKTDCSDQPVATASLDLNHPAVTNVHNLRPSEFNIHASGLEVFLDKA